MLSKNKMVVGWRPESKVPKNYFKIAPKCFIVEIHFEVLNCGICIIKCSRYDRSPYPCLQGDLQGSTVQKISPIPLLLHWTWANYLIEKIIQQKIDTYLFWNLGTKSGQISKAKSFQLQIKCLFKSWIMDIYFGQGFRI